MKFDVEIPDPVLRAVLRSATVSKFWARELAVLPSPGIAFEVVVRATHERRIVTWEQLAIGLGAMARNAPKQFGELLTGDWDAWTADALVQVSAFGEVRYAG